MIDFKKYGLNAAAVLLASGAWNLSANPITVQGSNTVRVENYNNSGNPADSPFPFEGDQSFSEFNINARQQLSQYRQWQSQLSGVLNDSDYRSADKGELLIERWNIKGECGNCAQDVPFRAEAGDYQAFLSLGTLQRSLKGVQLELQPNFGGANSPRHHSVQIIIGANSPAWRDVDFNDDKTVALSWLIEDESKGSLAFNAMSNERNAGQGLKQQTFGIAGRKQWLMLKQKWSLESEVSHFSGDHSNAANGRNRSDNGLFFEMVGKPENRQDAKGLLGGTYRFRLEQYGADYRPNGAVVSSNRRSIEAHGGWKLPSGVQARSRIQFFRNALESANPSDVKTIGGNLSGNLLKLIFDDRFKGVNGSLSGFVQLNDNANNTVDRRTDSLNLSINTRLLKGWSGSTSLSYNNTDDNIGTQNNSSKSVNFRASHTLNWLGFRGQISPSVSFRQSKSVTNNKDLAAGLSASIRKGAHNLSLTSGYNANRPSAAAGNDTSNIAFNYRYNKGRNTYGLEFTENYRDPENSLSSKGTKIAAFWTFNFDKRLGTSTNRNANAAFARSGGLDLLNFAPSMRLSSIAALNGLSPSVLGDFLISETAVLEASDQRQRLVILKQFDKVELAALIIDFDDTGSLDSAEQIFEKTKRQLIDRYGAADSFFERGQFSSNLAEQVANDAFIRTMDWNVKGGVLRFGIPRRLDGLVRMELQFARSFRPATDTLWSVEEIQ